MIHKEIIGHELYVWMNGKLLYKRWLKMDFGRVFSGVWGSFTAKDVDSLKINIKIGR